MIVTLHFLFLHNPKTGGIWFRNVCRDFAPTSWALRDKRGAPHQHKGIAQVPDVYRGLPTIAVVRNPWDWYVSWFFYNKARTANHRGAEHQKWRKRYEDCPANAAGFVKALPRLVERGSHQQHFLFGGGHEVSHIVRYERLREGLLAAVEKTGAPVTDRFKRAMINRSPDNQSKRKPHRVYYNEESRRMVTEVDRQIVDRFDYVF